MQLWKKNFLVTFLMFLLIIQGGLFLLHSFLYQNELKQWRIEAVAGERTLLSMLGELENTDEEEFRKNVLSILKGFAISGVRLGIELDGQIIVDQIPKEITESNTVEMMKNQGITYILISDSIERDNHQIAVTYMESMKVLQQNKQNRMSTILGIGILLSTVVGVMLYLTMKRINRPVSQIAHELRTPLTGIQGYAQYLMLGNLTDEDRFYAAQQIVESAVDLNDRVEKLLIMGGVREGEVRLQRIELPCLLTALANQYDVLEVSCEQEFLQADKTLLSCLLENLVKNAVVCGGEVKIVADRYGIRVRNNGEVIGAKKLKWLNRIQGVPKEYADRHGYGVRICHDIANLHGWKLFYRSSQEEGTTAEILF